MQDGRPTDPGGESVVPALCGVCAAGCAVEVIKDGDRIVRLRPRPNHPAGIVCTRGTRAPEIVYSPDRVLHPLRRVGARGEGRFERISWDEAMAMIVDRIHEIAAAHGPEALATYTGRGNFEFGLNEAFAPAGTTESSANAVLFPFGSPNAAGVGSLCYVSMGMIAPRSCFGVDARELTDDIDGAELALIWGANPSTASPPRDLLRLKAAKERGARMVVIDHRRSETARALGAEWVGIRPGTDGALALGMIHVVVGEQLYDRAFVADWTVGFDDLVDYVAEFPPERVERITGVPAETVRELARAIATARGCAILSYTGLEYSNSGVQAIRAVHILHAITGHLDAPGGKLIASPDRVRLGRTTTEPPVNARPAIGAREYPVYHEVRVEAHGGALRRAILESEPYPLRGLIVSGSSLITSWPEPERWREALAALDLLVVVDRFLTADAAYADVVLPATTMFEIESYQELDGLVLHRPRVVAPIGEARNDYLIFAELADRLGYGERWPRSERAMIERALAPTGITYDELVARPEGIALPRPPRRHFKYRTGDLRSDGRPGFDTPSGRFEIASEWLGRHGYDPLPRYVEPREGPLANGELAAHHPLVLATGARVRSDFRSQHHNIPSLVAMAPAPQATIHTDDAAARGILDGDEVEVRTPRGALRFRARVSDDIVRGVVEANMGGGGPLGPRSWRETNVNDLTDAANVDEISGFPVYKALLCEVARPS